MSLSNMLELADYHWPTIQRATARSLGFKAKDFLPNDPHEFLGHGQFGCVYGTADKRFVVKLSMDNTEGPHVALAMHYYQLNPGIAYFHRIWKLPERIWSDLHGNVLVWVMVREEVDVDSIRKFVKRGRRKVEVPAPGYKKIHDALEELPYCCSCLYDFAWRTRKGMCPQGQVEKELALFNRLLKQVATSGKARKGQYVAALIKEAWQQHELLFGDIHFGNVGLRRHDLSEWGVPRHKKLVITDLGHLGQAPRTPGGYPSIKTLKNPEAIASHIPVLQ